jgi:hypothetical protein
VSPPVEPLHRPLGMAHQRGQVPSIGEQEQACEEPATPPRSPFGWSSPRMKGGSAVLVPVLFPLVGKPDIRKRMNSWKAKVETSRS